MLWEWLGRGWLIGLSIAAPVGPIGLLCVRKTLLDGRRAGLIVGLGAASADAVYGLLAGFGLSVLGSWLLDHEMWLRLIGGLFLCYLGVRTWRTPPAIEAATLARSRLGTMYLTTFGLTLTNPLTILSFGAVFAGLGLPQADAPGATSLVLGVFGGSVSWWLLLTGGISLLRTSLTASMLRWINGLAGVCLVGFGLVALWGVW